MEERRGYFTFMQRGSAATDIGCRLEALFRHTPPLYGMSQRMELKDDIVHSSFGHLRCERILENWVKCFYGTTLSTEHHMLSRVLAHST